jgi:hypothetical protein
MTVTIGDKAMKYLFSAMLALLLVACGNPVDVAAADSAQGGTSMTAAPAMDEPAALAGSWDLQGPQGTCVLNLSADDAPLAQGSLAAPMHRSAVQGRCPGAPEIAGWRPIPLGLELDDARGFSTLVFERRDAGTYQTVDGSWTLRRR